jgi:hypothetical protein
MPGLASHLDVARRPRCVVAQAASLVPLSAQPLGELDVGHWLGKGRADRLLLQC